MYNYKIKTSFFSPEITKERAKKTSFNPIIAHFYFRRKLDIIRYDTGIDVASYYKQLSADIKCIVQRYD